MQLHAQYMTPVWDYVTHPEQAQKWYWCNSINFGLTTAGYVTFGHFIALITSWYVHPHPSTVHKPGIKGPTRQGDHSVLSRRCVAGSEAHAQMQECWTCRMAMRKHLKTSKWSWCHIEHSDCQYYLHRQYIIMQVQDPTTWQIDGHSVEYLNFQFHCYHRAVM